MSYEQLLESIESHASKEGLADFRLAREEFHNLTGTFEDSESWFELRMTMFLDWYLLDRPGSDGLTPLESFLALDGAKLSHEDLEQAMHLTSTLRSVFRLIERSQDLLLLNDLANGGQWKVRCTAVTLGLNKNDIIDARVALIQGRPTVGRGIVLHPREADESITKIVNRSKVEGMPSREIVDHLDKMRLKLDRYSNVRIQHVYRYPDAAIF